MNFTAAIPALLFSPAFLFSQDSRQPIIPSDLFKEDGREQGQKLLSSRCVSRVSCFPEMGGSDGVGSFQSFLSSFRREKKKESGWIGTQWWRSRLAHGRPWVLHPQHKGKNKSSFAGQCHTLALLCLEARAPCTAQAGLELMTLLSLPLRFSQQCPETSQP